MPYEIEFEDRGQDLIRLTVTEDTGEITDAGLCSSLYVDGQHFVDVDSLHTQRRVRFRRTGSDDIEVFRYLMTKLSLDGETLAEV